MVNHVQHCDSINVSPRKRNIFPALVHLYKTLVTKWGRRHKKSSSDEEPNNIVQESFQEFDRDKKDQKEAMNGGHSFRYNGENIGGEGFVKHRSMDNFFSSSFSRTGSRSHPDPTPSTSRCQSSTPILFSNSTGLVKPPPIEKELECTLEELCFGCKKRIKITREVTTKSGEVIQEEEMLTIKVKPGWKKGTKITFEGMGNERPGSLPADIIFVIAERKHHLFRREGDDLELAVSIPLVKSLTGCTIPIPLLGGEKTDITIEDIIHPGYQKIISGEGMPNPKEQGKRGDMILVFLIEFPTELTAEQRADIVGILEHSCDD
ncbi:hypothetical protein SLEP1_g40997 [Rubroshorea leprosula]|uniref:Chaperone DnaJ C-terminal domain-containing protein n=1 Tax=Rubroshorea leprosula TaxID=152421 RepID=A0AAV5L561_9ROSI|nr:hypothetical protein SLEP1_g40997 [Rubroshorea leprosula]